MEYDKLFLLVLALFLVTRLGMVYGADKSTEVYSSEEVGKRGAVAYKWYQGEPGVFFKYASLLGIHHQLGYLVEGAISSIFFLILGVNTSSLMLVVVLEGLGAVFLLYLLVKRIYDRKLAFFTCLFSIFSFPTWMYSTAIQPATVLLGIFNALLLLYLYIDSVSDQNKVPIFLSGILVGLTFFLELFQSILTFSVILLYHLFSDNEFKNFRKGISGLFLGAIPFFSYILFRLTSVTGSHTVIEYHGKSIFSFLNFYGIEGFLTVAEYFKSSFGFEFIGIAGMDWLYTITFIFCFTITGISAFRQGNRLEKTYERLIFLLTVAVFFVLNFTLIHERLGLSRMSLQRTYQYGLLAQTTFFMMVPTVLNFLDGGRKILKPIIVSLIIVGIVVYPSYMADGGKTYDPVRGKYMSVIDDSSMLYGMPTSIFEEFGFIHPASSPSTGISMPPFTRDISEMKSFCELSSRKKNCYRVLGMHFFEIRRFDNERSHELCERIEANPYCEQGISFALGYHISHSGRKDLCKEEDGVDGNGPYEVNHPEFCLKGYDNGRKVLREHEDIKGSNYNYTDYSGKLKMVCRELNSIL